MTQAQSHVRAAYAGVDGRFRQGSIGPLTKLTDNPPALRNRDGYASTTRCESSRARAGLGPSHSQAGGPKWKFPTRFQVR